MCLLALLSGSPWRVEIRSAAHVTATGQGLQLVQVRHPAMFEVRAGPGSPADAMVTASVTCKCCFFHSLIHIVQYSSTSFHISMWQIEVKSYKFLVP